MLPTSAHPLHGLFSQSSGFAPPPPPPPSHMNPFTMLAQEPYIYRPGPCLPPHQITFTHCMPSTQADVALLWSTIPRLLPMLPGTLTTQYTGLPRPSSLLLLHPPPLFMLQAHHMGVPWHCAFMPHQPKHRTPGTQGTLYHPLSCHVTPLAFPS